jgi:predicted XRE-type DNA-binding protein
MTTVRVKVAFRSARQSEAPATPPITATPPTPIARRIALAHRVEAMIERGELRDLAHAAERFGITRARMTQVADLALLDPSIQAAVLLGQCEPRDRHLRAVGRHPLWMDQRRTFRELFPNVLKEDSTHDRD